MGISSSHDRPGLVMNLKQVCTLLCYLKCGGESVLVLLYGVKSIPRSPWVGGEFNASMNATLLSRMHVPMAEVRVWRQVSFGTSLWG